MAILETVHVFVCYLLLCCTVAVPVLWKLSETFRYMVKMMAIYGCIFTAGFLLFPLVLPWPFDPTNYRCAQFVPHIDVLAKVSAISPCGWEGKFFLVVQERLGQKVQSSDKKFGTLEKFGQSSDKMESSEDVVVQVFIIIYYHYSLFRRLLLLIFG